MKGHTLVLFMGLVVCFVIILEFSINYTTEYKSKEWMDEFVSAGFDSETIKSLVHSDSEWFIRVPSGPETKLKRLCVAFGENPNDYCQSTTNYCAGTDLKKDHSDLGLWLSNSTGTKKSQVSAIAAALMQDCKHPSCPLIY